MGILEIVFISLGLSMDAFAVSICKGLSIKNKPIKKSLIIGLYFSVFHVVMLLLGYFLGTNFEKLISETDHWIAFILLVMIGGNMIKEAIWNKDKSYDSSISFSSMLLLSLAISIDALAVGITFAFLKARVLSIGIIFTIITFIVSFIGTLIGRKFGKKYKMGAQVIGGLILVLIGLKILLEHSGLI